MCNKYKEQFDCFKQKITDPLIFKTFKTKIVEEFLNTEARNIVKRN